MKEQPIFFCLLHFRIQPIRSHRTNERIKWRSTCRPNNELPNIHSLFVEIIRNSSKILHFLTRVWPYLSQNERKLASPYMAKLEINPVHRLLYDCVILCHCTLAAALYFEQSSCDELMEFKQIQTRAQPEESLKLWCNYGYVLMIPRAAPSFESV